MEIGVLSEGVTEEGAIRLQEPLKPVSEESRGVLHILLGRLVSDSGLQDVVFVASPRTRRRGKEGLLRDLPRLLEEYDVSGVPLVVVLLDRAEENQTMRDLRRKIEETDVGLSVVPGEAIEMFEAWLIADEQALAEVLEIRPLETGPDPEGRPGFDSDPESAKRWLHQRIGDTTGENVFEVKKKVALRLNLDRLATRCPRGFLPFRNDFLRVLQTLLGENVE